MFGANFRGQWDVMLTAREMTQETILGPPTSKPFISLQLLQLAVRYLISLPKIREDFHKFSSQRPCIVSMQKWNLFLKSLTAMSLSA